MFAPEDYLPPPRRTGKRRKWKVNDDGMVLCHNCETTRPRAEFGKYIGKGCKHCQQARRGMLYGALRRLWDRACNHKDKECTLTWDDMVTMHKRCGGLCEYSGREMSTKVGSDFKMSLERINTRRGYHLDNVLLVCAEFNSQDNTVLKTATSNDGSGGWNAEKIAAMLEFRRSSAYRSMCT